MSSSEVDKVRAAVGEWERAAAAELYARRARNAALRAAVAAGAGVREVARAAGMDPSLVSRIAREEASS